MALAFSMQAEISTTRNLTPEQVNLIFEYLGEP